MRIVKKMISYSLLIIMSGLIALGATTAPITENSAHASITQQRGSPPVTTITAQPLAADYRVSHSFVTTGTDNAITMTSTAGTLFHSNNNVTLNAASNFGVKARPPSTIPITITTKRSADTIYTVNVKGFGGERTSRPHL